VGSWLIHNVTLVTGDGARPGALRVAGGRIAEVLTADVGAEQIGMLAATHGADTVDGEGLLLVPGGVDPHVHFALPVGELVTVDDFVSGSQAALAGGTTTIVDFVTPGRGESLPAAAEARLVEAAASACDYALHGTVTAWRRDTVRELATAAEHYGLRSVKLYMAYLDTLGLEIRDLEPAMAAAAELDLVVLLHCEDGEAVAARTRDLLTAGRRGPDAHPLARTARMEASAVRSVSLTSPFLSSSTSTLKVWFSTALYRPLGSRIGRPLASVIQLYISFIFTGASICAVITRSCLRSMRATRARAESAFLPSPLVAASKAWRISLLALSRRQTSKISCFVQAVGRQSPIPRAMIASRSVRESPSSSVAARPKRFLS